ncbi:integrase core domain-containing protein [Herpetosiphon geysericola]|uniref:Integrase catalytic domain-containing protein n=1 Tax=Herpetosiphon geysericola TaxID=70996 RepID=A0A0P6XB97_9CHLR|nr:integrase core domain-containing protein [Herpetosiphon geysericola]KPL80017.1 hypothetical protein SE18_25895 [Herpetosiphon geysericola]
MMTRWFADRMTFYQLLHDHPDWSNRQFAAATQRSNAWVKKWKARLGSPPHPDPIVACQSQSRARKTLPPAWSNAVIERILALRDTLSVQYNRVVGAKTILAYLQRDPDLASEHLPSSPVTVWKILRQHQRIYQRPIPPRKPSCCPAPMQEIEIDFTDVTTIPPDPTGKRRHAVEAFAWIDAGTAIPFAVVVDGDFHMASVIRTTARILQTHGVPPLIRMDRDPRFVGSTAKADFPSPFMRLLLTLGIHIDLCPPQRPDKKGVVERFHKTYQEECLFKHWPTTEAEAQAHLDTYCTWYTTERPHQGRGCANRPPAVAYPDRPVLPAVPAMVDADGWLRARDGWTVVRRVNRHGAIKIDTQHYHIGTRSAGQEVAVTLEATTAELVVRSGETVIKRLRIKGLLGGMMPFEQLVNQLCEQCRQERVRLRNRPPARPHKRWTR